MSDSLGPVDSGPQAPPSMGFSRQEYWSGLPFHRGAEKRLDENERGE